MVNITYVIIIAQCNRFIHSYLNPKYNIVPDLEKAISSSLALAVQKELQSTICAITVEKSGLKTIWGPQI